MNKSDIFSQSSGHDWQSQGRQARAHRDNHHLPLRKGIATHGQLAATEQAISILLRSIKNSHISTDMVRVGLTVRLMLDLGRDAEQISALFRMHVDTHDPDPPPAWGLVSWECAGTKKFGWWLPAGVHVEPGAVDREIARGAIWLPVLERTKPWLEVAGLLQDLPQRPLIAGFAADITRDAATFIKWAKTMLGPLDHALPRADRLPGILTEQLAWQPTGDRTLASQISGRDMEHSVSRSYYTSVSTSKAAELYAKAMPSPISELSSASPADSKDKIAMPCFVNSALTRKNPKGALETMNSVLELFSDKPDGRQKGSKVTQAHKALVIRLWVFLALSMAIRKPTNWVPGLKRIEPRTGGLIVLDKDRMVDDLRDPDGSKTFGAAFGRARLIFLHPSVRELLVVYIDHLQKLGGRTDIDRISKELIAQHVKSLKGDNLMPFLELAWDTNKKALVATTLKPQWIEEELKHLADVPANFGRHAMRSGLLGQIPQSAIDALLGHFDRGTEPWSNGSAFDPSAYRALLNAIFEAHFKAAGQTKNAAKKILKRERKKIGNYKSKTKSTFNADLMERFWTLENDFLNSFADAECNLSIRRNRMLLCAVLFGGLLDPDGWADWIRIVMGKLRRLKVGEHLNASETRSIYISSARRVWFADPLTMSLYARPRMIATTCSATKVTDYARLIHLSEKLLLAELQDWVLPAAKTKATLMWPPLVVEHCAGALDIRSLDKKRWAKLEQQDPDIEWTEPVAPVTTLEPIRCLRPDREARHSKRVHMADRGFHFIERSISKAIDQYAYADNPTLALEREALSGAILANLEKHNYFSTNKNDTEEHSGNDLGWWINRWFLQCCPDMPLAVGSKSKYWRANTIYSYCFSLGRSVDWSKFWYSPLQDISAEVVRQKLHDALAFWPEGFGIAKKLYSFLGFGTLPRPGGVEVTQLVTNIKNQILTSFEFRALLSQLHAHTGSRGAHWLAAMLMFRCGLRPREIVALEVGHLTIVDEIVELKVAATPYVALKNQTSGRVLPLNVLLSPHELSELLKWRASRICAYNEERRHRRLLFASVYDASDYAYLFDPIEDAIRSACGIRSATNKERNSAAYIFSRCSVLRHSFVSYAVATMLFPRDDGGFQWPAEITPDLVSLDRRERLDHVLLADGHLGLSSLEAVRQLTGHARFQRTLGTYTHLMDAICGSYSWRRSSEPSLPAQVLCKLANDNHMKDTLSHYARNESAAEQAAVDAAINNLRSGKEAVKLLSPRERRPRGKTVRSWMPQGNTFLSQLRELPVTYNQGDKNMLPEWRRNDVTDWRTLDQIVQMASRGVPSRLIADKCGVRRDVVERIAQRYHRLLCLRRRTTAKSTGKHRHALLLQKPDAFNILYDADNGCWYGALKPLPTRRQERIDEIWDRLQLRRGEAAYLSVMRVFLRKHQNGRIQSKREDPLKKMSDVFSGLFTGESDVIIREFKHPARSRVTHQLHFHPQFRLYSGGPKIRRWPTTIVLLHLLLLAEAASANELPDVLVTTPVGGFHTDVAAKIMAYQQKKMKQQKEMDLILLSERRKAKRTQEEAWQNARNDRKVKQRERYAKQDRGESDVEVEIKPAKLDHNRDIQAQVAKRRVLNRGWAATIMPQ